MTNYQSIRAERNVAGLRAGDFDLVDIDDRYWSTQLEAGNIALTGNTDPEPVVDLYDYADDEELD